MQKNKYRFVNWAKNESCIPDSYYQPQGEEEIIELIKRSKKIRVVGTGHSWNSICLSTDTLINLDLYNRVLNLDTENLCVTVQSGIKLWQLNQYLDKHGFALKNLGSVSYQSLAGAISTGTHGSGIDFQILASQVEEFTLIKADGAKVKIHYKQDQELFNTCIVNLGALGIIAEMRISIVPAFNLHENTYLMRFEDAVNQLDELVHASDHFKMWWFPHTDFVVVYNYKRTQEKVNDSRFRQWFMDELVSVNLYRLLLKLGNVNREWRIRINRLLLKNFLKPINRVEKSFKVFNVPEPPLHRETEWAFDITVAKELLMAYKNLLDQSSHRFNFLQEIRFTKADNYALSTCYNRNSIWLGAYNADNIGWADILNDFQILAKRFKGRPHWGKEFTVRNDYLKTVYPEMAKFNQCRQEFDPAGKFENPFINTIFS